MKYTAGPSMEGSPFSTVIGENGNIVAMRFVDPNMAQRVATLLEWDEDPISGLPAEVKKLRSERASLLDALRVCKEAIEGMPVLSINSLRCTSCGEWARQKEKSERAYPLDLWEERHAPDCKRQLALAAIAGVLEKEAQ